MSKKKQLSLLKEIVTGVNFSDKAKYDYSPGKGNCSQSEVCQIYWYLTDDPNRPHKTSSRIVLILSQEYLDDYQNLSIDEKKSALQNAQGWITRKLNSFDEANNESYGKAPHVEWCIPLEY